MKITKREIWVSIAIALLTLAIAISTSFAICDKSNERNEVLNKALILETESEIDYAYKTSPGKAFVSGKIQKFENDVITHHNVKGEYLFIKEVIEEYRLHTRVVTYTDANGKSKTKTETYYSWDTMEVNKWHSENLQFNNIVLNWEDVDLPEVKYDIENDWDDYVSGIRNGHRARWSYSVVELNKTYSAFVDFSDGEMKAENKTIVFKEMSTTELYESMLDRGKLWLILVWFLWAGITAGLIFAFYYADNHWLNKDKVIVVEEKVENPIEEEKENETCELYQGISSGESEVQSDCS